MNQEAIGYFQMPTPLSWRQRVRRRFFPRRFCETPDAPTSHKDCLFINTQVYFGWQDRLRILFSGWVRVETVTVTENTIGDNLTNSVAFPTLPPKENL